jgi:hypothetical protein
VLSSLWARGGHTKKIYDARHAVQLRPQSWVLQGSKRTGECWVKVDGVPAISDLGPSRDSQCIADLTRGARNGCCLKAVTRDRPVVAGTVNSQARREADFQLAELVGQRQLLGKARNSHCRP